MNRILSGRFFNFFLLPALLFWTEKKGETNYYLYLKIHYCLMLHLSCVTGLYTLFGCTGLLMLYRLHYTLCWRVSSWLNKVKTTVWKRKSVTMLLNLCTASAHHIFFCWMKLLFLLWFCTEQCGKFISNLQGHFPSVVCKYVYNSASNAVIIQHVE